jgi:hypothetical protein
MIQAVVIPTVNAHHDITYTPSLMQCDMMASDSDSNTCYISRFQYLWHKCAKLSQCKY